MARRSPTPLEKKDVILYEGDWDELASYLTPRKIKPTVFIRELVHKKVLQIRAASAEQHRPTPELTDDDIASLGLDTLPAGAGESDEPE